jgi:protein SCO1
VRTKFPCLLLCAVLAMTNSVGGQRACAAGEGSLFQLRSSWTTDQGSAIKLEDLSGHYQIVAFIFTQCGGACPLLVKSLQQQARSWPAAVRDQSRFLLVSIDPEHDTVSTLRRYRKDLGLDERWTLLRGGEADVRELAAVLGFNYDRMPNGQFAHSNLITLLSPSGEIVLQQTSAEGDLRALGEAITAR